MLPKENTPDGGTFPEALVSEAAPKLNVGTGAGVAAVLPPLLPKVNDWEPGAGVLVPKLNDAGTIVA